MADGNADQDMSRDAREASNTSESPSSRAGPDFDVGYRGHGIAPGYAYGYYGPAYTWAYYTPVVGVGPDIGYGPANWYGPDIDEYAAVVPPGGFRPLSGPYAGRGPRGYRRSDERIREDVLDLLTADPHLDATSIEVGVLDGVVVLSGRVPDRFQKRRAEADADAMSGVRDVDNRLVFPRASQNS